MLVAPESFKLARVKEMARNGGQRYPFYGSCPVFQGKAGGI